MSHKVRCLNPISKLGLNNFPDSFKVEEGLEGSELVLVRSAKMHDLDLPKSLLAIGRAGAGVNNIPLEKCSDAGIVVFNTPGANANAVKELVLCSLLLSSRGIVEGIKWCRDNSNDENIATSAEKAKKQFGGKEIIGKSLGIIGLGAIGAEVCNAAIMLGMNVFGYDPYISVSAAHSLYPSVKLVDNIEDIYVNSDYITIHVPAVKDTIGMIDAAAISKMKNDCVFINMSRDSLVDFDAMKSALESGKISKYVTDFATPEVMSLKNTLVLPHLGASTEEAEDNCAMAVVDEAVDYIQHGNIKNSVNFPACNSGRIAPGSTRVCVLHKNVPNMVSQITSIAGSSGVNIEKLQNASKGHYAYTVLDIENTNENLDFSDLEGIEDVLKLRILH